MDSSSNMKDRALHFLNLIGNQRDITSAAKMMHPACQFIHDDQPPRSREQFLAFWPIMMEKAPNFQVHVHDTVCEGNKVWVFSKVTGRMDGTSCDDLHMFEFDDEGQCLKSHGVHRVIQDN